MGVVAWMQARQDLRTATRNRSDEVDVDEPMTVHFFYADWCKLCVSAKPQWKLFRQTYHQASYEQFRLTCVETNIDSPNARALMTQFNVTDVPRVCLQWRTHTLKLDCEVTEKAILAAIRNIRSKT